MSAKWHRLNERALKSLTSSMGKTIVDGSKEAPPVEDYDLDGT